MKYQKIGGMNFSKLAFGTDYFGTTVDEATSFALLDAFTDAGGSAVDTARMYANWIEGGAGASERMIGRWLAARGCRKQIVLVTKGGHGNKGDNGLGRLSFSELNQDMDESLEALGTAPDLYLLHRDNIHIPVEEIMETLAEFVKQGKTRYIGCSNWKSGRIAAANAYAKQKELPAFVTSEIQWSLASSTPQAHGDPSIVCMTPEEYGFYLSAQLPVMAFSSQAKGFFARGAVGGVESNHPKAMNRFGTPENYEKLLRVKELAARTGLTATAVALAYITCNALPAVALIGCKNTDQLKDTLTAADAQLSAKDIIWLNTGKK